MSGTKKISITIPQETHDALSEFAEAKSVSVSDAVTALIKTAIGRRGAVNAYAKKQAEAKRAAKAAAAKKAKSRSKRVAA